MSKIAYDLDGVLVPDCNMIPSVGGVAEYYDEIVAYMIPIFIPAGNYVIITGRKAKHRPLTWAWCNRYLGTRPVVLHHERLDDETPEEYKARILNNDPSITKYIESDPEIVQYLKEHVTTGCQIIHFSSYLRQSF